MNRKSSSTNMRGLSRYISELQSCQSKDTQTQCMRREMTHVRSKLATTSKFDGYEMKKSMAKVLFTYLQGFHVDSSYLEPLSLMSSAKYSEKQMGYLAFSTMLRDRSDIPAMVLPILRKDLASLNECDTCLALQTVSCISSVELARALGDEVLKLLISHTSTATIRKKAAVTALSFFRLDPAFVDVGAWADRLADILQHKDHALAQCVAALAAALVRHAPSNYTMFYVPAVEQLHQIQFHRGKPFDSTYHRVPAPWLQVQLLALLRAYPEAPSKVSPAVMARLHDVLLRIWKRDAAPSAVADVHQMNASYAVQLEALSLAVHIDAGSYIVTRSAASLGQLLSSSDTNVRYLAMEALTQLAHPLPSLQSLQLDLDKIFLSLSDRDISVRRRALDLLYAMCDRVNVRDVVQRLLDFLGEADVSLRQDMVFKISLLAEQHASESTWYIDTTLELFHLAGRQVDNTMWHRLVQVVTNHPKVHVYAAERIMVYLQHAMCHDILVMLGAYLLGEYGFLISDRLGCRPLDQFTLLNRHMTRCSPRTQAMCMSTFAKWASVYPALQDLFLDALRRYTHAFDIETKQRASEYVMLIELYMRGELDIQDVLDELPPFSASQLDGTSAPPNDLFKPNKRVSAMPVVSSVRRGEARRVPAMSEKPRLSLMPSTRVMSSEPPTPSVMSSPGLYSSDASVDLVDLHSLHVTDVDEPEHPWLTEAYVSSSQGPLLGRSDAPEDSTASEKQTPAPFFTPEQDMLVSDALYSPGKYPNTSAPMASPEKGRSVSAPMSTPPKAAPGTSSAPVSASIVSPPRFSTPVPIAFPSSPPLSDTLDRQGIATSSPTPRPSSDRSPMFAPLSSRAPPTRMARTTPGHAISSHVYVDVPFMCLFVQRGALYEGCGARISYERRVLDDASVACVLRIENDEASMLTVHDAHVHARIQSTVPHKDEVGIAPRSTAEYRIEFVCTQEFADTPQVDMVWTRTEGAEHKDSYMLHVILPISLITFTRSCTMNRQEFFAEWHAMRARPELEAQSVCRFSMLRERSQYRDVFRAAGFGILAEIDSRAENVVAAGYLHMSSERIIVLLRWEPNDDAHLARLTVRAPRASVASTIHALITQYMELM